MLKRLTTSPFLHLSCFDIFTLEEQRILKKYRKENFAEKKLVYSERRAIGKCPLTRRSFCLWAASVWMESHLPHSKFLKLKSSLTLTQMAFSLSLPLIKALGRSKILPLLVLAPWLVMR
ncbi:O-fucosyltransferase 1 [Camellia lanceoleosa]|uniref:O-fucosyltransferase 1 n=1 Tax=Camellia lanceoleosa TaxID=1840588 RepID=A0ACC0H6X7_9ERIC|nr:O-fucosyltransferase 1 [Camellia lanceoleosa]